MPKSDLPTVDFREWPLLTIHLPNTPIEGSISPSMMEAFLEVQTSIYRAHSLLTTQSGDLRGRSKSERESLEFRVKVSKGSSDYLAALAKPIETIGASIVGKMTPEQILISILSVALLIAGTISWKAWLNSRADQRKQEVHKEEIKLFLDAQEKLSDNEVKKQSLLLEAFKRQPILEDVDAAIEPARVSVVKAIGEEKGGKLQNFQINADLAAEITTQKRHQSTIERISGIYRVSKVDTTVPDGFRVTFINVENSEEITASLQDMMISEDHRSHIQAAEWNKSSLQVSFKAKKLRNSYIDAVVVNVDAPKTQQDLSSS